MSNESQSVKHVRKWNINMNFLDFLRAAVMMYCRVFRKFKRPEGDKVLRNPVIINCAIAIPGKCSFNKEVWLVHLPKCYNLCSVPIAKSISDYPKSTYFNEWCVIAVQNRSSIGI